MFKCAGICSLVSNILMLHERHLQLDTEIHKYIIILPLLLIIIIIYLNWMSVMSLLHFKIKAND